ncbi:hypothetical protein NpPPO83_00005810 [Neofusicoccum parvum]|uniref:Uncharacterized protein n=1 Tax=Neofusicoccum parvum TaxID=310453 RepID=A0ACB5RS24_9PEZI|nr:hypothetical protein NpPPO83_00005810 [Neofusicoccum parvum]
MVDPTDKGICNIPLPTWAVFSKVQRHLSSLLPTRSTDSSAASSPTLLATDPSLSYTLPGPYANYLVHATHRLHNHYTLDTLITQLRTNAHALMQYRLHQDYTRHLPRAAKKHFLAQRATLEHQLFASTIIPWAEISAHLSREAVEEMGASAGGRAAGATPWTDGVRSAAAASGVPARFLAWEVGERVRRGDEGVADGVAELVARRDWCAAGHRVVDDLRDLGLAFSVEEKEAGEKERMRRAVERVRDRYFYVCVMEEWHLEIRARMEMFGGKRAKRGKFLRF